MLAITKSILSMGLIFLFLATAQAQKPDFPKTEEKEKVSQKEHITRLGITISALLNTYPGFQINGTAFFSDHYHVTLDAGVIFYSITSNENSIRGYRLLPAFRYYLQPKAKHPFYFSVGAYYRKTTSNRIAEFFVTGQQLSEITTFDQQRTSKGIVMMSGVDIYVSKDLILDLGLGLGYGVLDTEDINTPENSFRIYSESIKYDRPARYDVTSFLFICRIQYLFDLKEDRRLKKKKIKHSN